MKTGVLPSRFPFEKELAYMIRLLIDLRKNSILCFYLMNAQLRVLTRGGDYGSK
jgi:hypothetical protein